VDTGLETLTGGRLKRVARYLDGDSFCFTYGDGVSDLDVAQLIEFHRAQGKRATLTAIQPPGRYGAVDVDHGHVLSFAEKPRGDGAWINGGFFVLEPDVVNYLNGDDTSFESDTLMRLTKAGELAAFQHDGFWHAMDTLRDKNHLEALWQTGEAPWKVWP